MIESLQPKTFSGERGETLIGILVALLISSIVMSATVMSFSDAWRRGSDLRIMTQTQTEARTVLDLMAYDLRMLGTGMPLGQSGFQIDDATLGTAALPILTTATATSLSFRVNETGASSVLTADYTPSSSALTISVLSTTGFNPTDTVYLSNVTTGGTAGMQAVVTAVTSTTLRFTAAYTSTASSVFKSGSLVERSNLITYSSASAGTGITRDSGAGAILLSPRSTFTVSYLDSSGTALTLPLTVASIKTQLAAVQLNATVTSAHKMVSGIPFTASAQQTVALRNLNFNR